jgi:hypothetical protein
MLDEKLLLTGIPMEAITVVMMELRKIDSNDFPNFKFRSYKAYQVEGMLLLFCPCFFKRSNGGQRESPLQVQN